MGQGSWRANISIKMKMNKVIQMTLVIIILVIIVLLRWAPGSNLTENDKDQHLRNFENSTQNKSNEEEHSGRNQDQLPQNYKYRRKLCEKKSENHLHVLRRPNKKYAIENNSIKFGSNFSEKTQLVVDILGVKTFQSNIVFNESIKSITYKVKEPLPKEHAPLLSENDLFASGYDSKQQEFISQPINFEKNIVTEEKAKEQADAVYNRLIDDDDASEKEEFWGDDDYAPRKSRNKAQTKAPHENVTKSSF